jgi:ADP-heptose:LPS heptosyltransferase
MGDRQRTRNLVASRAVIRRFAAPAPGRAPDAIARVLIAHNLLLGDTLLLTPLLAKLREVHPGAQVTLLADPAFVPLYAGRPYGVRAVPFTPREARTTEALLEEEPFDLAIVPGDNRYGWLAAAMGARHIVAHAGEPRALSRLFVDEVRAYRSEPAAWGEMVADLVDGPSPRPFSPADWPAPPASPFDLPLQPYAVLHVGASTPLKQWLPERWLALAESLSQRGLNIVWSAGPGEESVVAACDPGQRFRSYAGRLDLSQLWHLLMHAAVLIAPDTGVAHLGRVTWTPTVTLLGPGSSVVLGPGEFWREAPWRAVTVEPFECRDQQVLFGRQIAWLRRCGRSTSECAEPRCMQAIGVDAVLRAVDTILRS